jgi:hypothetical protein
MVFNKKTEVDGSLGIFPQAVTGLMKMPRFLGCESRCQPRVFVARNVFLSPPCKGGGQGWGDENAAFLGA